MGSAGAATAEGKAVFEIDHCVPRDLMGTIYHTL
jgi:hypothetical protein